MTTPTPFRLRLLGQPVGELLGEAFLDLGAVGERLHDTRRLRQAGDPRSGEVSDVRDADERQQMMSHIERTGMDRAMTNSS